MPAVGSLTPNVFDHAGKLAPASKVMATFTHPAIDGMGVIQGPKRQAGGAFVATTYHYCANRADAMTLVGSIAAMVDVDAPITIDPAGDGGSLSATKIAAVAVLSCETEVIHCRGLPPTLTVPNTCMVVAHWRFLIPVGWTAV